MDGHLYVSAQRRRGSVLLYQVVILIGLLAMASFAVDFGTAQLAKSQLRAAADAAALAGASVANLQDAASIRSTASQLAAANNVLGSPASVLNADVEPGQWNTQTYTFTPSLTPYNAVRVTTRREAAHGNAVPLAFASAFGMPTLDESASAIAYQPQPPPDYNLVGLDYVNFSSLGVLAQITGRIVSNGNIHIGTPLGLLVGVKGDARSWGGSVTKGALAGITGSTAKLPDQLVYPSVELPLHNDNAQISGYLNSNNDFTALIAATIPSGTYVVRDLNLVAGLDVRLQGPVMFYVQRNFNVAVSANLLGATTFDPSDFKIRVAPGGQVFFLGSLLTPMCMDLYAPDSPITIAVTVNNFRGRMIGKSLDIAIPALSGFTELTTTPDPPAPGRLVK